jgi:MATE family multidrug resistance protein
VLQKIYKTYESYFKRIVKLSYPIVIGQLGIVLMGVADVIMVGKVGPKTLAAAAFANSIYFLVSILGVGTLSAVSPLVATAKGASKPNSCAVLFRQAITSSLLLSAFICSVMLLLTLNLHWFGQEPEVAEEAKSFLHVINISSIFMLLFVAAKQFSDGLSITKPSAIITVIALLLNVLLNWIFIYGKFGVPAMGLFGAGVATLIARVFMAIAMLVFIFKTPFYKAYLTIKDHTQNGFYLKQIFKIGLPSGFQYTFEMGAFATAAIIIGWFGAYQLAAHQVAINIASVTYMIATGVSAAGSIAVGDAVGRKHKEDLLKSGRAALIMGAVFMAGCALMFALFNGFIVRLYTNDVEVTAMATKLLLIAALFQLSDGIQCVALGVLRGISDTKIPTLVTVIAYWVVGIPFGWFIANHYGLSLYGIWYGLSLGLTFSAIMLTYRFLKHSRRINFVEQDIKHYNKVIS